MRSLTFALLLSVLLSTHLLAAKKKKDCKDELAAEENESTLKTAQAQGIHELGLKVLTKLRAAEPKGTNLFISGFNLHEAFSMALNGAEGASKKELAEFLGINLKSNSLAAVNDYWAALLKDLQAADPNVVIEIANSMWGNTDWKVQFAPKFIEMNKGAHNAELVNMSFQDAKFVSTANKWISDHTHGKIDNVLKAPIRKDQLWYLIAAIYFNGTWTTEFKEADPKKALFTFGDGSKPANVPMMNQSGRYDYSDEGTYQVVRIPYGKTKRMVMTLFLPKENSQNALSKLLDRNALEVLKQNLHEAKGSITIPRFKIEYGTDDMAKVLKELGLEISFSDAAEFPGISLPPNPSTIDKVIHRAIIEVTEKGTEAAAVTVIGGVRITSVQPDKIPFRFVADHPFYFEIEDQPTGTVLFSGIVNKPVDPKKK